MPVFNQIWISSADLHASAQYGISRKSVQWEPRRYVRTKRRTDMARVLGAFRDYAHSPKTHRYYDAGGKQQYSDTSANE